MCYTLIVSFRTIYALPCILNEDTLGKDREGCAKEGRFLALPLSCKR